MSQRRPQVPVWSYPSPNWSKNEACLKKFEYGSIHLQAAGIVNDMYAVAAAASDTGDLLPMTKENRNVYIMGVIMT